ncbi:MAG: MFS transporter [Trueperaceae bacterium]
MILQSFGAYAAVWSVEFGWSKTALALAYSMHRAEAGLLGPVQGWLIARVGIRTVLRSGVLLLGIGFLLLSRVDSILALFLTLFLTAIGGGFLGLLSLSSVIVSEFERSRSKALAVLQFGISLGGLAVPIMAWALVAIGWRPVAVISGLLVLTLGFALTQLVSSFAIRADKVRVREGGGAAERDTYTTAATASVGEWSAASAVRTSAFWLVALGHAGSVAVVAAVNVHLVVFLTEDMGYSVPSAAMVFALITAASVMGHVLGGIAGDKFSRHRVAAVATLGHFVAMVVLAVSSGALLVVLFAVTHGLAWGIRAPLMGALRADYFGVKAYPLTMGVSSLVVMLGSLAGPLAVGTAADVWARFDLGFLVLAGIGLLSALAFALARPPVVQTIKPSRASADGLASG